MATIHPYNPDIFHSLQSPGDAAQDFSSHDIKLLLHRGSELSQLFLNHKVGTDIAIELLHRHFEVPADKRLVRVGRVVTPWSTSLFSAVEQQSGLGRLAPSGILVRDGAYYPYEFRHLSKAEDEAEAQSSGGKGRLVQHAAFLEQFALFVQDKGISHVLGLRTLSAEEKRRVEDPAIHDYEVTDDGYHMTVLSTDAPMEVMVSDEFSWALVGEEWRTNTACKSGTEIVKCACSSQSSVCKNSKCSPSCECSPYLTGHAIKKCPCEQTEVKTGEKDCC